ncbi:MAG: Transcriptional regulator, WhiB family, partial [uncultured Friedmanniella sp.]
DCHVSRGLGHRRQMPGHRRRPVRRRCRPAARPRPVRGLPGSPRVPRGGARRPHRVGRVGRHDRARAPGPAAPPARGHLVARAAAERPVRRPL